MQIISTSVNTVRLHLSGSGALIGSLRPEQVKAKLDLSKAVNGQNLFSLTKRISSCRRECVSTGSNRLKFRWPLMCQPRRSCLVQVDWVGSLPKGLILESVSVAPNRVVMIGAKEALDRTSTLYTEKVKLDRIDASGQLAVALAPKPGVRIGADGPSDGRVTIRFAIGRRGD